MSYKALALLSGGLDSTLAVKVILDMGIDVIALNFTSVFCTCTSRKSACKSEAVRVAEEFGIPIKVVYKGLDYFDIVRKPKFGYGRGMNPCIDCRIYMFKRAKEYMAVAGASFIFTGEVLGQRPMSQRKGVFEIIDRESGLDGLVVRPLCARHLLPTIPENEGILDRKKLLNFTGRTRKPQINLAESLDIYNYPCPAGGCLLTDPVFSKKVRDLVEHKRDIVANDLVLLKVGRHFRTRSGVKIVVGRNETENRRLANMRSEGDTILEPVDFAGPVALVSGCDNNGSKELAARIIFKYAGDKAGRCAGIRALSDDGESNFTVNSPPDDTLMGDMRL